MGIKIYRSNSRMFLDVERRMKDSLLSNKKIIDLGSDKDPEFANYLAKKYGNWEITHFKDIKTLGKINKEHKYENLKYAFKTRSLKEASFDMATAFFTLHEFPDEKPDYERTGELEILHKVLKPNGKLVVIEYNLPWVQKEDIDETDFIREIFTETNERRVMNEELRCMQTHTSYGLEECIETCEKIGFKTISSTNYHIQTSWGIKPKIYSYIGEKIFRCASSS